MTQATTARRPCEVCGIAPTGDAPARAAKVRRVLLGERIVALCDTHAARLRHDGVDSVEDAQRLFREREGQRSRLERRSPLDRRIFPPRPEGRRRNDGRRRDD